MSAKTKLTEWLSVLGKVADLETSGKSKKHVITLAQTRSLFSVMQNEGMNIRDHGRALKLDSSTISKNLSDLGSGNGRDRKGMGLVELMTSPDNMSAKLAYLTPKGRDLRDQLTKGTGAK